MFRSLLYKAVILVIRAGDYHVNYDMHALIPSLNSFNVGPLMIKGPSCESVNQTKSIAKTDPNSDESLLIAVGNTQDTNAFNQLFTRFSKKIFAMGMKLTRNEQVAHDLVQEAMLTVWQKAPLYDLDRGTAQSWIFTLTRNRCFDMLRKQKRQPSTVSADDIWPVEGDGDAVFVNEERGSLEVEIAQIERFYADLPEAQQAVVKQIFVLDRTHEEAAKALQIPLGTLKSRLRLGVGKLRQLIGTT
ncbi:MAG: RNA polymerase sigma-70 factor (ECF subfamily) [Glaciecola sp.]|jgi:RNA polymerase sigma-70 factor (ECF subfamily)